MILDIGDLLETVSQQVGTLEELKKETLELECSLERTMNEYIRVCERLTKTLSFVIEEYKLGQQFKYDNVAMQWIQHRYNTMILKLKCVHISFFSFPILLSKKKGSKVSISEGDVYQGYCSCASQDQGGAPLCFQEDHEGERANELKD